ncbi:MAG TPA: hypothetical protein VFB79_00405 [Candidatus Angelobacter sp.]|nr:hypothetical protein [Candidatus Angelobacter sp.]
MNDLFGMRHTRGEQSEHVEEQWVNEVARKQWSAEISIVKRRWREVEWRSVEAGLRECALLPVPDAELPAFSEVLTAAKLDLVPLQRIAATGTYANRLVPVREGEDGMFFCLVSRRKHAAEFLHLWKTYSHAAIGRLLGYPSCCSAFFENVWAAFSDTTWPMACNTPGHSLNSSSICAVTGPWQTNILLRWLGVRAVPHFPCSFTCEATIKLANALADICPKTGRDLCREILQWPVEWSAMNGCAEIRTPQVTIITSTDVTEQRYTVQRVESAQGSEVKYDAKQAQGTFSGHIVDFAMRRP